MPSETVPHSQPEQGRGGLVELKHLYRYDAAVRLSSLLNWLAPALLMLDQLTTVNFPDFRVVF